MDPNSSRRRSVLEACRRRIKKTVGPAGYTPTLRSHPSWSGGFDGVPCRGVPSASPKTDANTRLRSHVRTSQGCARAGRVPRRPPGAPFNPQGEGKDYHSNHSYQRTHSRDMVQTRDASSVGTCGPCSEMRLRANANASAAPGRPRLVMPANSIASFG